MSSIIEIDISNKDSKEFKTYKNNIQLQCQQEYALSDADFDELFWQTAGVLENPPDDQSPYMLFGGKFACTFYRPQLSHFPIAGVAHVGAVTFYQNSRSSQVLLEDKYVVRLKKSGKEPCFELTDFDYITRSLHKDHKISVEIIAGRVVPEIYQQYLSQAQKGYYDRLFKYVMRQLLLNSDYGVEGRFAKIPLKTASISSF